MTTKRAAVLGGCLGLGLICLLLVLSLDFAPWTRSGGLSVTFVGLTNDAAGGAFAQFDVANTFGRRVQLGVGAVQIRGKDGWPSPSELGTGTGDWLAVEAGSNLVFSVRAPALEEPAWRVPLIYEEDPSPIVGFLGRIRVNVGSAHWRLRRKMRASFVVGPTMVGLSNQPVQRTAASRSAPETNGTSSAAGSQH